MHFRGYSNSHHALPKAPQQMGGPCGRGASHASYARQKKREREREAIPAQLPCPVLTYRPDKDHRRSAVRRVKGATPWPKCLASKQARERERSENTLHSDGDVLICATTALNLSRGMKPPLDFSKAGTSDHPKCYNSHTASWK